VIGPILEAESAQPTGTCLDEGDELRQIIGRVHAIADVVALRRSRHVGSALDVQAAAPTTRKRRRGFRTAELEV
jgi:hypothetical protein